MLPNFNLEWRHRLFSFLAGRMWNSLPPFVKKAKDILTFKRILNKQIF